jgi:hypothetical protein
LVFSFCWILSTDLFACRTTVLTLSDAPVCNVGFSLTSLIGIGDAKHFKVLRFGDIYLPFLVGVEVTANPERLKFVMLLDGLPFC